MDSSRQPPFMAFMAILALIWLAGLVALSVVVLTAG
jgi:hypothetical protein